MACWFIFVCFFLIRASLFDIGLVTLCYWVLFGCYLVYSTSAINCLERPGKSFSEMTYYMLSGTLNSRPHSLMKIVAVLHLQLKHAKNLV